MKIRTGFVSNSSSSSFCIFGKVFNLSNFIKVTEHGDYNYKDYDELNSRLYKLGLDMHTGIQEISSVEVAIGINAYNLPGDKTLNDIREEIAQKFILAGVPVTKAESITFIEDAGYNG